MSHVSKVEVSPFQRFVMLLEVGRGMGSDARRRAAVEESVVVAAIWTASVLALAGVAGLIRLVLVS